jgi:ABC-type transporter MlaC component
MTSPSKPTVATRTLLFTKIIAAIAQYITAAIILGGKSITPQALAAIFQAYLLAEQDLEAARTIVTAKQQTRDAALAAVDAVQPPFHKYLVATYGEESTTFANFGLPVTQKTTKTAEVKAAAAAKAKATRAAHKAAPVTPATAPATPVKA